MSLDADCPPACHAEAAPHITDEDREQYQLELRENAGRRMDAGASEAEANQEALREIGDVETWLRRTNSPEVTA
jgi:hypothetical protein